jgi:hypothetical protein
MPGLVTITNLGTPEQHTESKLILPITLGPMHALKIINEYNITKKYVYICKTTKSLARLSHFAEINSL